MSWRFGDAADGAGEDEAALPVALALPAALDFVGEPIEPAHDALAMMPRARSGSASASGSRPPTIAACSTIVRL